MIDHIFVGVIDVERCARFYGTTLAALGLTRLITRPRTIGSGKVYPEFWINLREAMPPVPPESGVHICERKQQARSSVSPCDRRRIRRRAGHPPARLRALLRSLRPRSRRQPDRNGDVSG